MKVKFMVCFAVKKFRDTSFFPENPKRLKRRVHLTLSLPRVLSSKLRKKILNFILQNCQKQTVLHESTAQ